MESGGAGKSYLINTISAIEADLTKSNRLVTVTTSSCVAGYIVGSCTAHKLLGLNAINFEPTWGLFNGATGTVVDIVYEKETGPHASSEGRLPKYVELHMTASTKKHENLRDILCLVLHNSTSNSSHPTRHKHQLSHYLCRRLFRMLTWFISCCESDDHCNCFLFDLDDDIFEKLCHPNYLALTDVQMINFSNKFLSV